MDLTLHLSPYSLVQPDVHKLMSDLLTGSTLKVMVILRALFKNKFFRNYLLANVIAIAFTRNISENIVAYSQTTTDYWQLDLLRIMNLRLHNPRKVCKQTEIR